MRLFILSLCSLIFWNCSDNYSPINSDEQYQNSFLIQQPCAISLTIAESVFYEPVSTYLMLSQIIYEYDADEPTAVIKRDNYSNGSASYLNLKLNDNFYVGSNSGNKVYARIIGIYADDGWITLSIGDTDNGY